MLCIGEIQALGPTRNPKKVSCDSLWSSIQGIVHWIVHGTWANPTVHCQHLVIFQKFSENQFDTHYLIIFILNQKCKKILHIQQWWKSSISEHVSSTCLHFTTRVNRNTKTQRSMQLSSYCFFPKIAYMTQWANWFQTPSQSFVWKGCL
jgi:hypothetical protein